jgi:predicted outer membrane protein
MAGAISPTSRLRRSIAVRKSLAWIGTAFAFCVGTTAAIAQTPIPPSAKDFAMAAAQSDQYEIQAGRDAIAQSQNRQLRAFAQQMIDDHTRTSESLRQAVAASGMTPPPQAMSSDQAGCFPLCRV